MHSIDLTVNRIVRVRHESKEVRRKLLVPLMASAEPFKQCLTLGVQGDTRILAARET